jgi:ubiquitin carboxyl-terminal hydrolase 8
MQNFQSQGNMFQNNIVGNALNNTQKKSKFPQHRTGIQNIGQTCYMNATLQALSNIVELSKPLLKKFEQKSFDIENQILAAAYSSLLYELFYPKDNKKYISPNIFKEIIGELNPLFKGMHAADAKDLIFFIIERMNKELNPIKETPNPQINFEEQEKLSLNENVMLQSFLNDFRATNNTIITKIFYGVTRSIMKCLQCNTTKYSFQTFNLLIFQLKKIKEMIPKKEKIGLLDAFEVEKREEILDGDNMIYCNKCRSLQKGMHQQQIYCLPRVLIIVLNRGRNNKDFNEQFKIPLLVDFSINDITISKQSYREYYLCGIITHLGESGAGGHFIAYSRDGPYSQFYCYNDAMVSPVKNEDVLQTIISEKEYEKKTPYILLYHHYTN